MPPWAAGAGSSSPWPRSRTRSTGSRHAARYTLRHPRWSQRTSAFTFATTREIPRHPLFLSVLAKRDGLGFRFARDHIPQHGWRHARIRDMFLAPGDLSGALCPLSDELFIHGDELGGHVFEFFLGLRELRVQIHLHCHPSNVVTFPAAGPSHPPLVPAESRQQVAEAAKLLCREQPFRLSSMLCVQSVSVQVSTNCVDHAFHLLSSGFEEDMEMEVAQ